MYTSSVCLTYGTGLCHFGPGKIILDHSGRDGIIETTRNKKLILEFDDRGRMAAESPYIYLSDGHELFFVGTSNLHLLVRLWKMDRCLFT